METIDTLDTQPFKNLVMSIGALPSSFVASMSYYEALAWLVNYLQTQVIPAVNNNAEALSELQTAFITLKDYVDHYFDNLDVQEEINNKLDEMVEDGTMQAIVASILNTTYLIEEIETTEYYNEPTNTHYWITHIPHLDKDGNVIKVKHGLASDVEDDTLTDSETPREFAKRSGATICINASIYGVVETDTNYHHVVGCLIKDKKLISNYGRENSYSGSTISTLGVKEDGSLKVYPYGTTYEELIADGVENTFCAFDQLVTAGVIKPGISTELYQWNVIGQNSTTKDIYLIECNGKNQFGEQGMQLGTLCQKLVDLGCDFAFRLDQGGSTCLCQYGSMLNYPTDDYGLKVRPTCDFLYFGKDPVSDIDKNMMVMNAQRSDDRLEAMFALQKGTYARNIENSTSIYNYPSIYSSSGFEGIRLTYKENGTTRCNFIIDPTNNRKGISVYDSENQKTIMTINNLQPQVQIGASDNDAQITISSDPSNNGSFRAGNRSIVINDHQLALWDNESASTKIRLDSTTNTIQLGSKYSGAFFSTAFNVTNLNDAKSSGFFGIPSSASNKPFSSNIAGVLIVIKSQSQNVRQFAIPDTNDSTTNEWYTRNWINSTSTWESWKKLAAPVSI